MPSDAIDTGTPQIDTLLKNFFNEASGEKLEKIKEVINDHSSTIDTLEKFIPFEVIMVTYMLSDKARMESLFEQCSDDGRHFIMEAKNIIDENFPNFGSHPQFNKLFEKQRDENGEDADNVIDSITSEFAWIGAPPTLTPFVRLNFLKDDGKLLLDTTLDTDDLVFVIGTLTDVLCNQLDYAVKLSDLGNSDQKLIRIPSRIRIGKRMQVMQDQFRKIKLLLPKLGIEERMEENPDAKSD